MTGMATTGFWSSSSRSSAPLSPAPNPPLQSLRWSLYRPGGKVLLELRPQEECQMSMMLDYEMEARPIKSVLVPWHHCLSEPNVTSMAEAVSAHGSHTRDRRHAS